MAEKFFSGAEENPKKKDNKDEIEVAIRVNKRALERTFYIITILVLVGVIVFLILRPCGPVEVTNAVVGEIGEEATETPEAEEVEEEPEVQEEPEETTEPEEEVIPPKTNLEAEIIFSSSDIETDSDLKVTQVRYKVKNKGMKFVATAKLRWYDKDEDSLKDKIRSTDDFILNEDQTVTKTMEEFSPKYIISDNEEIFILELYKGSTLVDTALVKYTP